MWHAKRHDLESYQNYEIPLLTVERPLSFGAEDVTGRGIGLTQILLVCQSLVIFSLLGWLVYRGQSLDGLPSPIVVSTLVGLFAGGSLVYLLDRWRSRERKVLKRLLDLME